MDFDLKGSYVRELSKWKEREDWKILPQELKDELQNLAELMGDYASYPRKIKWIRNKWTISAPRYGIYGIVDRWLASAVSY